MTRTAVTSLTFAAMFLFAAGNAASAPPYDHLKCYKIRDTQTFTTANADIGTIEAAFPMQNCRIKKKAKLFCIPATKNVTAISGGTDNPFDVPTDDLGFEQVCYKVTCPQETIAPMSISDQFGTRMADHFKASTLCVPAAIGPPPVPTTTSTTTTSTTTTTTSTTTTTTMVAASAWSLRAGNSAIQNGIAIAVDGAGNTIAAGNFLGDIKFGSLPTMTSLGSTDIFVVKIDSAGTPLWSVRYGDASSQQVSDLAIGSGNDIVLTGSFQGSVDFGGGSLTSLGGNDIYVARLDSSGAHQWSMRFGDTGADQVINLEIDATGDVLVTGTFASASIDFGGGAIPRVGSSDCFVARFSSAGAYEAANGYGGTMASCFGVGLDSDPMGNVALAAFIFGTVDFGGGGLMSAGGIDTVVAKYTSAGSHLWSKRYGDGANQQAAGVAFDSSGNVYVGVSSAGTINFGGSNLMSAGGTDMALAKLDPNGNHIWSALYGDSAAQTVSDLLVDASGNLHVSGSFAGAINLGAGPVSSLGGNDAFFASYDPAGTYLDSAIIGAVGEQTAGRLAVDGSGARYVTGSFDGSIDLGDGFGPLNADGTDPFIARLAP